MKKENLLGDKIDKGDFIITAEYLPKGGTGISILETLKNCGAVAVNVSDNPYGPVMSSLAASVMLRNSGVEPVFQIVTRDRNRIALQSDILGAAALGIRNILCLSGYHQSLSVMPESANVYDIDSIQLVDVISHMNKNGTLMDGSKIEGSFSLLTGAVANPYLRPLELNVLRLAKKVEAGARFIQTQAVFDTAKFKEWLDAIVKEGLTKNTAILAGIYPLESYNEAAELIEKHTDFHIPEEYMKKLKNAGSEEEQKKTGMAICVDTIKKIKGMKGLQGIHIMSGGKENIIADLIAGSGL